MPTTARDFYPGPREGFKWLPADLVGNGMLSFGNVWWVDGDDGDDGNNGKDSEAAFATIANAITEASAGDTILIKAKDMAVTDTDPASYAETVTLSKTLNLIGVVDNRTQGGLPQIKIGAGSTAMVTVAAPGCLIANLGFNGASSTGGGILLDDDGGSTKSALGFRITNCHFKNCKGATATNAATGGAIQWAATGGAWQGQIDNNRFYKNVGDIVLKGTTGSRPQDIVIEDNHFSGPAASVDCNIYGAGGSGFDGVHIARNVFPAQPAIGSGTNALYMDLTGCVGILAGNFFGTDGTLGAAGNAAKVPTTVFLSGNHDEGGLIART